jgi:hypothetical protein
MANDIQSRVPNPEIVAAAIKELRKSRDDLPKVVEAELRSVVAEQCPGADYDRLISSEQNRRGLEKLKKELIEMYVKRIDTRLSVLQEMLDESSSSETEPS